MAIKREFPDTPCPPAGKPKRTPGTQAAKKKADTVAFRNTRIDECRKKYNHNVVELALKLIPDDIRAVADTVPTDRESLRGLMSLAIRRIMVRYLWVTPDVRSVVTQILLPRGVPQAHFADHELYVYKAYSHVSLKFRKAADELASQVLASLKLNVPDDDKVEAILSSHETFSLKFSVGPEDLGNLWRFAIPTAAPGVIIPMSTGGGHGSSFSGISELWGSYVQGVTMIYLRRRMYDMLRSGGEVNAAGSLELIKHSKFTEFGLDHFRSFGAAAESLPPLATSLPATPAEWASFVQQADKLMTVIDNTAAEVEKMVILPTPAVEKKFLKRFESAERFHEWDLDEVSTDIDIESIADIPNMLELPGE